MRTPKAFFTSPHRPAFLIPAVTVAAMAAMLTGCGGDSHSGPKTGTASIDITDAPADGVEQVQLTIDSIELKPKSGGSWSIVFAEPLVIENLLDLDGTNAVELLGDTEMPAGEYNWVRLNVSGGYPDSWVMTDEGGQLDLFVPGQQPGNASKQRFIQLSSGFTVPAGGNVDYTLDVDVRKALTKPSGKDYYLIRPSLRITDNAETGTLTGSVDPALFDDSCTNDLVADEGVAVYLYNGSSASTGDVFVDDMGQDLAADSPLTTDDVVQNLEGIYTYTIGFVPAGDYTLALTCQSLDDDPSTDDSISFLNQMNVSVSKGNTTTYDFVVVP